MTELLTGIGFVFLGLPLLRGRACLKTKLPPELAPMLKDGTLNIADAGGLLGELVARRAE
jgi:hypothetical protein